jgi:hypothetical protein
MKFFNVLTTLLFFVFFVNISTAQTIKKQQTNKERLSNKAKTGSNIKSADFSKDEKKDITSPEKNIQKPKQLELKRNSSKIKMISPTTVVPNTTKGKNIRINKGKLNNQRKKIKTKKVEDE